MFVHVIWQKNGERAPGSWAFTSSELAWQHWRRSSHGQMPEAVVHIVYIVLIYIVYIYVCMYVM